MGFVGGQGARGLVTLLALSCALEGRSLPVVHGCGWDSGAARERSSALAASVAAAPRSRAAGVPATRRGRAVSDEKGGGGLGLCVT